MRLCACNSESTDVVRIVPKCTEVLLRKRRKSAMVVDERRPLIRSYRCALVSICAVVFLDCIAALQLMAYSPYLVAALEGTALRGAGAGTGLLFAPYSLFSALFNPVWSAVATCQGVALTAAFALAAEAACVFGLGMASSLRAAIIWRACHGASAGTWALLQTRLRNFCTDEETQIQAFGSFAATYSAATCVAPLVGGALFGKYPRLIPRLVGLDEARSASLPCACCALGLVAGIPLVLAADVYEPPASTRLHSPQDVRALGTLASRSSGDLLVVSDEDVERAGRVDVLASLARNYNFLLCVALYCMLSLVFMAWELVVPLWASATFGLSPRLCGCVASLGGVALTANQFLFFGPLVRRFGPIRYWRLAWLLAALVFAAFPFAPVGVLSLAVAQVLVSVALGSCFPIIAILINNAVDTDDLAPMANGLAQASVSVARASGPAAISYAYAWSMANEESQVPPLSLGDVLAGRAFVFLLFFGLSLLAVQGSWELPSHLEERRSCSATRKEKPPS